MVGIKVEDHPQPKPHNAETDANDPANRRAMAKPCHFPVLGERNFISQLHGSIIMVCLRISVGMHFDLCPFVVRSCTQCSVFSSRTGTPGRGCNVTDGSARTVAGSIASVMRKRCRIRVSATRISVMAKFRPMQVRGPAPNGRYAYRGRAAEFSGANRSGRNTSGSGHHL